jgi:hypothetical protein
VKKIAVPSPALMRSRTADAPYSEPNREQSGGNGKHDGLAHLSSPIHSAQPQHAAAYAGL